MDDTAQELPIGFQFGMFMRVFRKLVVKRFLERDTGLTLEQFAILYKLSEDNEPTVTDIANMVGIDKSAVMRIIDLLESKHFVARMGDENDRRRKMLVLTKKGADKLEETRGFFNQIVNEICEGIEAGELNTFLQVMNRMRQNAENL